MRKNQVGEPTESPAQIHGLEDRRLLPYSETRVAAPRKHDAKWLFPQEKATSRTLGKGTFTLVSL
jgi:hypothetical protein